MLSVFQIHHVLAQAAPAGMQDCSAISNSRDRQRCEETFSQSVKASSRTAELDGGWRLVRTPNPQGGAEAISIMHVSDTARSDFALAGLTLRCGGSDLEPLLIVLEPLPGGSHPPVTVKAGSSASSIRSIDNPGRTSSSSTSGSFQFSNRSMAERKRAFRGNRDQSRCQYVGLYPSSDSPRLCKP